MQTQPVRRVLSCCPRCQRFWMTQGAQIRFPTKEELSPQEKTQLLTCPEVLCVICVGHVEVEAYGGGDAGYGWFWTRASSHNAHRTVFQAIQGLHFLDRDWHLVPLQSECVQNPEHYQQVVGWLARRPKLSAPIALSVEDLSSLSQCYPVPPSARTTIWKWKGIACSAEHPQFGQVAIQVAWMIPDREPLDHRLLTRFWRHMAQRLASNPFSKQKGTLS